MTKPKTKPKRSKNGYRKSFELFNQGKVPTDPEFAELDIKPNTVARYYEDWTKLKKSGQSTEPPPAPAEKAETQTKSEKPIEVGKITIKPENWGMTQYGAIIILDTYERAKRDIGYEGSVGEFIQDVFTLYRRIQNYQEVRYAGQEDYRGHGDRQDGG